MKTNRKIIWMIAVLCTALPDIGAGTATPAIALVAQAMPDVSVQLIQMIVSIPSVCLIFFPPIYAKLTMFMRKKTLLWIAFITMLIGAVGPMFADSIYMLLTFRFILGLSNGIIMPITVDLILDIFEGKEKQSMLGYAAAVTSIGGIIFQVLGGIAGSIDWHYCFLATAVSVPFYLFALILLPDLPPAAKEGESRKIDWKACLRPVLLCLSFFMIMWEMLYFVFLSNISLYMVNSGLADTAQVGVITAMVTIGGMIMSALYGRMIGIFKERILPLAYLITAIGFAIICVAPNAILVGVGALAVGIGYGISAPCQLNLASSLVPEKYVSVATSVCYTSRGIGGFVSPMVFAWICVICGKEQGLFPFQVATFALAVLFILVVIYVKKTKIQIR